MVVETRSVSVTGPKSTGGCLDECGPDGCIEGEPQQVWQYVGPGQGQYDKVERYAPVVGGSWKIEQVNKGIKWGSCAGWFSSFAAIAGIIVLVVIYRGVVVSAVSHDIEVVSNSVGRSPLSLFNCSRGSWTTSLKAQLDQASQVYRTSLWKQSDTNFDGILGADELSSSSSKLPSCFAQQIYQWDQDGNGLTQEEIEAGLQVEDVMDAEAEKMFAYADLDCDGALSLSELDHLHSEAQLPKYTTDLLGSADVDADNRLSKLEFVAAMRKSGVATAQGALLGEVWNETKRQWCCNYQAIGCGTYVYDIEESTDCSHGVFELWSSTKREKCCQLEGRGCLKRLGPYDKILLGPPCTEDKEMLRGSAPGGLSKWSAATAKVNAERQLKWLHNSLWLLREGGVVLYFTRALSVEEDDGVIQRLFQRVEGLFDLQVMPLEELVAGFVPGLSAEPTDWGARIMPDKTSFGPMFFSRLRLLRRRHQGHEQATGFVSLGP